MGYLTVFTPFIGAGMALLRALANVGMMASLFYGCWWWLRRQDNGWQRWLGLLLLFLLITVGRTLVNQAAGRPDDFPFNRNWGAFTWIFGSLVTNFGIVGLSYLFFLDELRVKAEFRSHQQSEQRRTAELQLLRSHINPHFLFNVMNNIYSLSITGSDQTAPTVLRLSSLLRYVTYQGQKPEVSLSEEVEQLQHYIDLFLLRTPDNIDVDFSIEGSTARRKIEPMLLLPMVENAFKHGDFIVNPVAFAHFKLTIADREISFTGENSFDPNEVHKDSVGGVGLENIRQRLALTYPGAAELRTTKDDAQKRFSFALTIKEII